MEASGVACLADTMKLSKQLKHGFVFFLTRRLIGLVNAMPRRLALFFGATGGLAVWSLLPKDRYKITRHLGLVYGLTLTPAEKHNIGRAFFINSGKNLVDAMRFRRHFQREIKPFVTVEGLEHFDSAYKRQRGVIGITGHIGNFELLAVYIASLGYKTAVIGRELYDPRMDEYLLENRAAMGMTNIATTDSPRRMLKWLSGGGVVGVLIDTDSSRVRGMFMPVFGRPAQTAVGHTIMGLRTGAAFVPIACLRNDDDTYRIVVRPEITLEPCGDFERDVYNLTLKCSQAMERLINENKAQWIWLHNRWCARPPESA
jgi:KDO2-lipid IV(A) lauroyltransferase